jgi:hypothetical protein
MQAPYIAGAFQRGGRSEGNKTENNLNKIIASIIPLFR